MSGENIETVRGMYDALGRGEIPAFVARMSPDIVWNEADNFIYADGNPYRGPEAVMQGVFARLGGEWDGFAARVDELLDAGDVVVALGHYEGTFKASGRTLRAQFAHVWRLRDGQVTDFQQYADTLQVAQATGAA